MRACKAIPTEEVQRLSEFDADGRSLKAEWQTLTPNLTHNPNPSTDPNPNSSPSPSPDPNQEEWQTLIDDATKRLGTAEGSNPCRQP